LTEAVEHTNFKLFVSRFYPWGCSRIRRVTGPTSRALGPSLTARHCPPTITVVILATDNVVQQWHGLYTSRSPLLDDRGEMTTKGCQRLASTSGAIVLISFPI